MGKDQQRVTLLSLGAVGLAVAAVAMAALSVSLELPGRAVFLGMAGLLILASAGCVGFAVSLLRAAGTEKPDQ